MITYDRVDYITATEVAEMLQISRGTCKSNVLPLLTEYYLPGRKRAVYRLMDLADVLEVRIVERKVQPLAIVPQEDVEAREAVL
ncbi:MAG: hypothetical protein E6J34_24400 [Chloroflexi bacterium]|nr:MAG: hypothetical protein E6J34_24400 [Chloroflexota bacterium]